MERINAVNLRDKILAGHLKNFVLALNFKEKLRHCKQLFKHFFYPGFFGPQIIFIRLLAKAKADATIKTQTKKTKPAMKKLSGFWPNSHAGYFGEKRGPGRAPFWPGRTRRLRRTLDGLSGKCCGSPVSADVCWAAARRPLLKINLLKMTKTLLTRVILTWLLFLPVPVLNGLLREKWYKPATGELRAHVIGTLAVSLVFLLYAYLFFKNDIGTFAGSQLLIMGLIWLAMTLIFEFGLGLATGRSWSYMLADYNICKGRIWPLLLAVVFLSPYAVRWIAQII